MEGERCQAEYMFGTIPAGTCDQGLHCVIIIIIIIFITNVIIAVQMEGERCQAEYMFGMIPAGTCDQGLHCVKQKNIALGAGKCVKSHPDVDLGLHPHHTERGQSGTSDSVSQSISSQSVNRFLGGRPRMSDPPPPPPFPPPPPPPPTVWNLRAVI